MTRKLTMTDKWRASLVKARAAREAKAKERGSRYTDEGLEKMRQHGAKMVGNLVDMTKRGRAASKMAAEDADALIFQLFEIFDGKNMLVSELTRRSGVSANTLRAWRKGGKNPTLGGFRDVAFALGYVVKLEPFDKPKPREVSTWVSTAVHRFNPAS